MVNGSKCMESDKIRVVWLCHFSNSFVHEALELRYNPLIKIIRKFFHKPVTLDVPEFANWITNGIKEFENIKEVELHVVSPYPHLKNKTQNFTYNGIYYHFFQNEDDTFFPFIYKMLIRPNYYQYSENCRIISKIIDTIKPSIVHLFGAENPYYALGVLRLNDEVITLVQLQTLMNDPDFRNNYPLDNRTYNYRSSVEKRIIFEADYLGVPVLKFRNIIKNSIKSDAVFLNTTLPLNEPIFTKKIHKTYDFVYFAANIDKSADLAIEAFGLAHMKDPNITLDIIGGYDEVFKQKLDLIIQKYNIDDAITFEGKLPTHQDVLLHIRKSRFAILPLKIDLTSGTIREAMANGLPVITTDTGELGTQLLNNRRQNVLLSKIGDHQALANNMLLLLEDVNLAETLRNNAYITRQEVMSNEASARRYVDAYIACIDNFWKKKPLPKVIIEM